VQVDTSTNTITTITPANGPDSLIFAPNGNIIYSSVFAGTISAWNGVSNVVLAVGLSSPQDLALDPGGATFLFSTGSGNIDRMLVAGGPYSVLSSPGSPTGLAYDGAGDLFAVNGSTLLQLNPVSGAILNSVALPSRGDGLTYDPFTGNLWVGTFAGIIEVPTSLSSATFISAGNSDFIDGLVSDGAGNIFLADTTAQQIVQYNITGNTFTGLTTVPTLDDLAPLIGLGSAPVTAPEPATLALLGIGAAGLLGYGWRRRKPAQA